MAVMAMRPMMFLILTLAPDTELSGDFLALLDPVEALEQMGQAHDRETLAKLIAGEAPPPTAATTSTSSSDGGDAEEQQQIERAIQNLASRSEKTRQRARETLIAIGPSIRERIEELEANDERRSEEAKLVLKGLKAKEASNKEDRDLLRILAIRAAAQKGIKELAAAIRESVDDKNVFVENAATTSLHALTGEPVKTRARKWELRPVDCLPASTNLLIAIKLPLAAPGKKTHTLSSLAKMVAEKLPEGPQSGMFTGQIDSAKAGILEFTRTYGNVRIERILVVNAGELDDSGGGMGILFQGKFERNKFDRAMKKDGAWSREMHSKVPVYTGNHVRLVSLNSRNMLLLPDEGSKNFPLEEYIKAFKAKENSLAANARMAKFLNTLRSNYHIRGLALTGEELTSEIHRELERETSPEVVDAFRGMKEAEFQVTPAEDQIRARVEAAFEDQDQAETVTTFLDGKLKEGIAQMEQMAQRIPLPVFQKMIEVMKAMKFSSAEKKGLLRLDLTPMGIEEIINLVGGSMAGVGF